MSLDLPFAWSSGMGAGAGAFNSRWQIFVAVLVNAITSSGRSLQFKESPMQSYLKFEIFSQITMTNCI